MTKNRMNVFVIIITLNNNNAESESELHTTDATEYVFE